MWWIVSGIAVAWVTAAAVAAIWIGRAIRIADHKEGTTHV